MKKKFQSLYLMGTWMSSQWAQDVFGNIIIVASGSDVYKNIIYKNIKRMKGMSKPLMLE